MKPLSNSKKSEVEGLLRSGMSYRAIKDCTGVSVGSISSIRKSLPGLVPKSRGGRPRKFSERDVRQVCRVADQLRVDNAVQIATQVEETLQVKASRSTIVRALQSSGYRSVKKGKKPLLTSRHRRRRLEFAKTYINWTSEDWQRVIWSDETKVNRILSDGLQWSWHKAGRSDEQIKSAHGETWRRTNHGLGLFYCTWTRLLYSHRR